MRSVAVFPEPVIVQSSRTAHSTPLPNNFAPTTFVVRLFLFQQIAGNLGPACGAEYLLEKFVEIFFLSFIAPREGRAHV